LPGAVPAASARPAAGTGLPRGWSRDSRYRSCREMGAGGRSRSAPRSSPGGQTLELAGASNTISLPPAASRFRVHQAPSG
jgi:hypothetical protein